MRLAKHQSIRALEGLEARLPHLLRGRHRRELLLVIDIKIFINKRSKYLQLVKIKVYFIYISPNTRTTEAFMDSKGSGQY